MQEHAINSLDNFICGWYSDDTTICDRLIEYHKNSPDKSPGVIGAINSGNQKIVSPTVKDSMDCVLKFEDNLTNDYINYLQKSVEQYIIKYPYCNASNAWGVIENISVQHYVPPNGGFPQFHNERGTSALPIAGRHLVFMTYLNTVEDGGETEFYHQKIKVKPVKGLTLIWPADWTFTHRGIPSPTQEKYVITGWFNYLSKD